MESRTFTVQQIYQDRRQYRVPFYQRAYVWNRENQWEHLWEDIRDKAEARIAKLRPVPHFMGAVVLEPQPRSALLGVEKFHIIDGQQRLTTLQFVLTALWHVVKELDQASLLSLVDSCLVNPNPQTMEEHEVERFKLWPTFRDRDQLVAAMTAPDVDTLRERFPNSFTRTGGLKKIGVNHPPALEAILYFRENMICWARDNSEGDVRERCMALASAVLSDLSIICISLGADDDAQVIFETLNGRGAELHATDLIRNFIFMRANNDADELYSNLWSQFESELWSTKESHGRLSRPRLEWFMQAAIQAELADEFDIGRLYASYRRFVDESESHQSAAAQLSFLNRYAAPYRELVTRSGDSAISIFGREIDGWDATSTYPLALHVAVSNLEKPEQLEIFNCIVSYLVRRAVCGLSRKNYNKVFLQVLKKVSSQKLSAGTFRKLLSEHQGDASRWPGDDEFRRHWLDGAVYPGRLDAPKLRSIFYRLEIAMRTHRSEEPIPLKLDALDVDHIMPRSWAAHWPLADGQSVSEHDVQTATQLAFTDIALDEAYTAIIRRETHIPQIGNLTLVHYGLNRGVQNLGYERKRKELFEHSNLQLNRSLMQLQHWDEDAIRDRGEKMFELARHLWQGPT